MKKGATKMPTCPEDVAKLSDNDISSRWRVILDASGLSPFTSEHINTLPFLMESLTLIRGNTYKTICDMSSSYHQLLISDRLKELFCFHSAVPEHQHFCATRLSGMERIPLSRVLDL